MSSLDVKWKLPGLHKGVDPNKCYEEILEIGESATAEQIVERARDESSELHKCIEWDNSVAAEKFRLEQARLIVQHLVVTVITEEKEPINVRVLQIGENAHEYKQTTFIMRNESEYAAMLSRAIRELRSFEEKYKTLTELERVFEAIEELA